LPTCACRSRTAASFGAANPLERLFVEEATADRIDIPFSRKERRLSACSEASAIAANLIVGYPKSEAQTIR
jgi:hypothetical protein